MLNQFVLMGKLLAIYDKYFIIDIEVSDHKRGKVAITIPQNVSSLLDNRDIGNIVGVKGHIQSVIKDDNLSLSFVCERISQFGKGDEECDE